MHFYKIRRISPRDTQERTLQIKGVSGMTGSSKAFERHLLVAVDAVGYGRGSDQDHFAMQSGIKTVLHDAAATAKLDRDRWGLQRAGDGELAILPLDEPEPLVVDAYARQLDVRLSNYNATLPADRRIRLRMAVHFGSAMPAENGYAGQGVVAVSRLVDSAPVRDALTAAPDATLVLALTRQVYDDVVRQGHVSFSAADFTRVLVRVKEFQDEAWIKVFGTPAAASPPLAADRQKARAPVPPEPAAVVHQTFNKTDARGSVFGVSIGGPGSD
jgi:hypothetical protein